MTSPIHSPHFPNLTVQGNRLHILGQGRLDIGKGSFATWGPDGKLWYCLAWKSKEIGTAIFPGSPAAQRQKRSPGN